MKYSFCLQGSDGPGLKIDSISPRLHRGSSGVGSELMLNLGRVLTADEQAHVRDTSLVENRSCWAAGRMIMTEEKTYTDVNSNDVAL